MRGLALVGLLLFVVAWFVPVHEGLDAARDAQAAFSGMGLGEGGAASGGLPTAGPSGWRACRVAWQMLTEGQGERELKQTLLGLTSLTNLAMLVAGLVVLSRGSVRAARALGFVLLACLALDLGWLYHTDAGFRGGLEAGYWLWVASFGLVGVAMLKGSSAT